MGPFVFDIFSLSSPLDVDLGLFSDIPSYLSENHLLKRLVIYRSGSDNQDLSCRFIHDAE